MTDTIDDVAPKQRRRSRTSLRTSCNGWFGGSSPVRANHPPAGDLHQVVRADFRTTSVISGYACFAQPSRPRFAVWDLWPVDQSAPCQTLQCGSHGPSG
jgi:hypothetical protein